MRVLLVVPSYYPIVGGTENFVRQLANKLNDLGTPADVMTLNMTLKWKPFWRTSLERGKFTIYRMSALATPFVFLPIDPLNLLLRINVVPKPGFANLFDKYDVIHFCDDEDLSFPFFSLLKKKPKILHMLTPIAFAAIQSNFFQRAIFKRLADFYIPSSFQLGFLLDMGIDKSKVLDMVSVGVNEDVFKPDESKRLDSLILYVGRLQKLKGVHILLEALMRLKSPVNLVIIGPFDEHDPAYSEEIRNLVNSVNSQGVHRVQLLGCLREQELVPWYQKATIFVAPHLDQICSGLTGLEALACATPIVATGNDLIENRVNGIQVPPNNVEKIAEAIDELLMNKELRKQLGFQGRRIIEEEYTWTKIAQDFIKVYEKMLTKRRC